MFHGGETQPLNEEGRAFLSTQLASNDHRRLALGAIAVSAAAFAALAPFAKLPLPQVWAFLPAYEAALVFSDLLTGPQTTAWIYFLWHGAFPLLIAAYALLKHDDSARVRRPAAAALAYGLCAVGAACALTLLATAGHDLLPVIMQGNRDATGKIAVAAATWALSLGALAVLWRRRPHSVVDLWLMVVMCAWIFDVALAAVLNAGRFDLGWYAGRAEMKERA